MALGGLTVLIYWYLALGGLIVHVLIYWYLALGGLSLLQLVVIHLDRAASATEAQILTLDLCLQEQVVIETEVDKADLKILFLVTLIMKQMVKNIGSGNMTLV